MSHWEKYLVHAQIVFETTRLVPGSATERLKTFSAADFIVYVVAAKPKIVVSSPVPVCKYR